jgi:hypothetical protein
VQIDNFGRLRISGERPLGADGNRWRRFGKEFEVPDTCDAAAIRARLDKQGVLLITMPKLSATAPAEEPAAPGANTGAAGQDHEPAGHAHASAPQARTAAAAAGAGEEKGHKEEHGTRAAAAGRPGGQQDQDEQQPSSDDDAGAATEPAGRRPAAYGFAKDGRTRKVLLAIFAVMLALVVAGLFARYTMDPSAETPSSGNHIVSLSDI